MNATEIQLREALSASHMLAELLEEADFPVQTLEMLQQWQRDRLAKTYADLLANKRYQAAGHFFLDELYGGLDFKQRDQEVERVLPVMLRMLPGYMLISLADAFELQRLSLELDIDMAKKLGAAGLSSLDKDIYGDLYRETGRFDERKAQIALICRLGGELSELVRHRLVLRLIKLLRIPARAAGFGRLQSFLEEGLWAFREMGDGSVFMDAIRDRETLFMQALVNGNHSP